MVAALSQGRAISIAPHNTMLTTQEAAELLGVSRPTLVRLLREGEIPFGMRGRHRRVLLRDVLECQGRAHREREDTLDLMAADAEEAGLYEATDSPRATRWIGPDAVAFPAFLDTCVLCPAYLCDTLLRLARVVSTR